MKKEIKDELNKAIELSHNFKMETVKKHYKWSESRMDAINMMSGHLASMCERGHSEENMTLKEVLQMIDRLTYIDLNEVYDTGIK